MTVEGGVLSTREDNRGKIRMNSGACDVRRRAGGALPWRLEKEPSASLPATLAALLLATLAVTGCPTEPPPLDTDGDGAPDAEDCAPEDPNVYPEAEEICDGLDTNCSGHLPDSERDADGDGSPWCLDCDDTDASLHPHDDDADGVSSCNGDCDDADPLRLPGNPELSACDGIDDDCVYDAGEADVDGDGALACADDCDDTDPSRHPYDEDGDGVSPCGGDCDDADPTRFAGNAEVDACDGLDQPDSRCPTGAPRLKRGPILRPNITNAQARDRTSRCPPQSMPRASLPGRAWVGGCHRSEEG